MTFSGRFGAAIAVGLTVVASVLLAALPGRAQDGGLVRTATLLVDVASTIYAAGVPRGAPDKTLVIAADPRKNPTKSISLTFALTTLPVGATITDWALRLQVDTAGTGRQVVRAFPSPAPLPKRAVGMVEVSKDQTIVDMPLAPPSKERWGDLGPNFVSLILQSVTPSLSYGYHANCDARTPCADPNRQPRLIVRYTLPPAAAPVEWPQPDHDAQLSRQTAWRPSSDVGEVALRTVYPPNGSSGLIEGAPVLARGVLILHTQRAEAGPGKYFVTTVYASGARGVEIDIGAAAKFPPLADRRGYGWVVAENDLLGFPHDLASTTRTYRRPWDELLGASTSVRAQPTLGASDALYLSTNRGVFAMSLYPGGSAWWRLGGNDSHFGAVALSQDEGTAFVVDGTSGKLVALDNTDGRVRWRGGAFTRPDKNAPLPVPIVALQTFSTQKGGEETVRLETRTLVWVVDGHDRGKSLQAFDAATGQSAAITTTGYFSRPVVSSNGTATAVRQDQAGPGRLCHYSALPGRLPHIEEKCQPASAESLSTLSVLASDGKGNVYVIDGTSDPQKVRGYRRDLSRLFTLDVPATTSAAAGTSTNFGRNVLVGADGTLFVSNANALFAIEPKRLAQSAPAGLILNRAPVQGARATTLE